MIEVELPDGRVVEFPAGTSEDTMRTAIQELLGGETPTATPTGDWNGEVLTAQSPAPERTFMQALGDNVIGYDDGVDSVGEKAGRVIQSAGAGMGRGVEGLLNLPGLLMGGINYASEKTVLPALDAAGIVDADEVSMAPMATPRINLPPAVTDFDAQNRTERMAGTVGEFLPGALALGPAGPVRNAIQYGILPGVASEAAGEATEGTAAEPWARIGAGILAPAAMSRRALTSTANLFRPNPERVAAANQLQQAGVTPTAGQAVGSDFLRRLEGAVAPTGRQFDDFTEASMRFIGSDAPRATPEALLAARNAIVQRMDDAVAGVSITPTTGMAQSADDIAAAYIARVPAGQLTPRIRGIAEEIAAQATSTAPRPISLSTLRTWRSDIGRMTQSPDGPTRDAAHALRLLIDEATDTALRTAGRDADIPALAAARNDYRNFLAVRDAATRAGAEGGTISPVQLNQSIIRTQGREAYGLGQGTDLSSFARAGAEVLRPLPAVNPGGVRGIEGAMSTGLGVLGYMQGGLGAAAAGIIAPAVGRAALRAPVIQNLFANPAAGLRAAPALSSGILAGQPN